MIHHNSWKWFIMTQIGMVTKALCRRGMGIFQSSVAAHQCVCVERLDFHIPWRRHVRTAPLYCAASRAASVKWLTALLSYVTHTIFTERHISWMSWKWFCNFRFSLEQTKYCKSISKRIPSPNLQLSNYEAWSSQINHKTEPWHCAWKHYFVNQLT